MPEATTLGQRLRTARQRRGLSQADLAASLGVAKLTVLHWEGGNRGRPRTTWPGSHALESTRLSWPSASLHWLQRKRARRSRQPCRTARSTPTARARLTGSTSPSWTLPGISSARVVPRMPAHRAPSLSGERATQSVQS
ncbi:MAG: helix-turn-helix transcriptional regulator [Aquincola sp.]|nr:helix-turn-helix transcriptional regulator [Aquincola sp.]